MLIERHQRFRAINPGLSNPPCVTVGFAGLANSYDLTTSHADGLAWRTDTEFGVGLDVPIIPHQVEAVAAARGVFDNGVGIVTYGGRGFAVPARVEPSALAYASGPTGFNLSGGQGGQFAVTLEAVTDENDNTQTSHWRVASATAQANVGSGYASTGFVVVPVGNSICAALPSITLGVGRGPPTLTARPNTAACNCASSGAEFEIVYEAVGSGASITFTVSSIHIVNGGSNHPDTGSLAFALGLDDVSFGTLPTATFEAQAGTITAVTVLNGGVNFKQGVPTGTVTVSNAARGAFYKEDRTLPVYTYSAYVSEYQIVVDTDIASDTFGQVTEGPPQAEEDDGPPYECRNGCLASYNDREYVLCTVTFGTTNRAVRLCVFSNFGGGGLLQIVVPEDYDNAPTGIGAVVLEQIVAGVFGHGSGYAVLARVQPSPVLTSSPGSGATFLPTLTQSADSAGRPRWSIASVIVSGGSGYQDQSGVNTIFAPGLGGSLASGRLNTRRIEPVISATPCTPGASLAVELYSTGGDLPVWQVSAVNVLSGGEDYFTGVPISFAVTSPNTRTIRPACGIGVVDESGSIVRIEMTYRGEYYRHTDVPHSVFFDGPGLTRGLMFQGDDTLPALVATIEVKISQNSLFSQGSGALVVANVDTNPASVTFGQIVSATVQAAGSGYKLLSGPFAIPRARLLATRHRGNGNISLDLLPPVTATEFSTAYYSFNQPNQLVLSSIEAHVTAPDCNGVRKAEVILREPGFDIVESFRTNENFCARAFVGESAQETIALTAVDELGGSAYLRLNGDSNSMEVVKYAAPFDEIFPGWGNNCRGRLVDDCEICRTPQEFQDFLLEIHEDLITDGDSIPKLFPIPGYCNFVGTIFPDQAPAPPLYWAELDDEGLVLSWYKMCGGCPDDFEEQPPLIESILYSRIRCECDLAIDDEPENRPPGHCFWKPADCETGQIVFDKSTCTNPLP